MEHVIAIGLFVVALVVWAVIQKHAPRSCIGCQNCENEGGCAEKRTSRVLKEPMKFKAAPPGTLAGRKPGERGHAHTVLLAVFAVGLGGWLAWQARGASGAVSTVKQSRPLMGTIWTIEVVPAKGQDGAKVQAALDEAFAEVARIEALMSEWRPGSPLSELNARAGKGPVPVPAELRALIERGLRWGEKSGGAFDITWRGMGRVWRLYDEDFTVPTQRAVAEARARVDYRKVAVDGDRVSLADEGMAIGLGGIAKGYAVDRVVEVLKRAGLSSFYVAGAGDIRVVGGKGGAPWRVGVRNPRGGREEIIAEVDLVDGAITTSGDYERFRMIDGVRYHHIIDPRTGYPAQGAQAATIVAQSAEAADALATAVFVLGREQGLALVASEPGASALIVDAKGAVHLSPGFAQAGRLLAPAGAAQARR